MGIRFPQDTKKFAISSAICLVVLLLDVGSPILIYLLRAFYDVPIYVSSRYLFVDARMLGTRKKAYTPFFIFIECRKPIECMVRCRGGLITSRSVLSWLSIKGVFMAGQVTPLSEIFTCACKRRCRMEDAFIIASATVRSQLFVVFFLFSLFFIPRRR